MVEIQKAKNGGCISYHIVAELSSITPQSNPIAVLQLSCFFAGVLSSYRNNMTIRYQGSLNDLINGIRHLRSSYLCYYNFFFLD